MEVDLDLSVGELLVGKSDGIDSLLEEVLFWLVQDNLGEGSSIESDPSPLADDDSWKEKFVKDGGVNSRKSSTIGPSLSLILLDPSRLYLAAGEQKDGLLQLLLELSDQFFIDRSEQDLMTAVVDMDKNKGTILLVGVLNSLGNADTEALLLAICVEMVDGLN